MAKRTTDGSGGNGAGEAAPAFPPCGIAIVRTNWPPRRLTSGSKREMFCLESLWWRRVEISNKPEIPEPFLDFRRLDLRKTNTVPMENMVNGLREFGEHGCRYVALL